MMLAKLGYAPGQYNPNFWILLHGMYIAWWLAGWGSQHLSSSCTCTRFRSSRGILAGYRLIAERRRRG
ncbi:PREDICTED: cytosolic purine, partial [Prunus dulcis]